MQRGVYCTHSFSFTAARLLVSYRRELTLRTKPNLSFDQGSQLLSLGLTGPELLPGIDHVWGSADDQTRAFLSVEASEKSFVHRDLLTIHFTSRIDDRINSDPEAIRGDGARHDPRCRLSGWKRV